MAEQDRKGHPPWLTDEEWAAERAAWLAGKIEAVVPPDGRYPVLVRTP